MEIITTAEATASASMAAALGYYTHAWWPYREATAETTAAAIFVATLNS